MNGMTHANFLAAVSRKVTRHFVREYVGETPLESKLFPKELRHEGAAMICAIPIFENREDGNGRVGVEIRITDCHGRKFELRGTWERNESGDKPEDYVPERIFVEMRNSLEKKLDAMEKSP